MKAWSYHLLDALSTAAGGDAMHFFPRVGVFRIILCGAARAPAAALCFAPYALTARQVHRYSVYNVSRVYDICELTISFGSVTHVHFALLHS